MIVLKCYKFHNFVKSFCEENNISSMMFKDFLMYNYNGITSETYRHLYTAPLYYLVNSKAFTAFYKKLDADFKNDIITPALMHEIDNELCCYPKLIKALHRIMKGDSRYVYTNSR